MADSVDVLRARRHELADDSVTDLSDPDHLFASIQAAIDAWTSSTTFTSIDDIETTVCGQDRVAITIAYTA